MKKRWWAREQEKKHIYTVETNQWTLHDTQMLSLRPIRWLCKQTQWIERKKEKHQSIPMLMQIAICVIQFSFQYLDLLM